MNRFLRHFYLEAKCLVYFSHSTWIYYTVIPKKLHCHLYSSLCFKLFKVDIKTLCQFNIPFFFSSFHQNILVSFSKHPGCPLSVHVQRWSHIPGCLRGAGGRRKPEPSRWCGRRRRWTWSIRRSSRSLRWSKASREQLAVHHMELNGTEWQLAYRKHSL